MFHINITLLLKIDLKDQQKPQSFFIFMFLDNLLFYPTSSVQIYGLIQFNKYLLKLWLKRKQSLCSH